MAKKKTDIPSGFEDILGNIYSNAEEGESITNIDEMNQFDMPLVDDDDKNEPPVIVNPEDGNTADQANDPNAHEDDSPEPPVVVNNPEPQGTEPPVEDPSKNVKEPTEEDVTEAQQVGLLFDMIGSSLGWNMDDIAEEDRPLNVEDSTQNSKRLLQLIISTSKMRIIKRQ